MMVMKGLYAYHVGTTLQDKREADRVFLNNMLRIIGANTHFKPLAWLRTRRAYKYYWAVDNFGGPALESSSSKAAAAQAEREKTAAQTLLGLVGR